MSFAAGRIDSSPTVKGFLALAMWLDTKNDALNAETFDKMAAFNNCFFSSCSHKKKKKNPPEACLLMHSTWSPCGTAVLKVSWLHLDS